jgi:hypothetical protein
VIDSVVPDLRGTTIRTVTVWAGLLLLGVLAYEAYAFVVWNVDGISAFGYQASGIAAAALIIFVGRLSFGLARRLLRPDSRNTEHPVLVASLTVLWWYAVIFGVVAVGAAVGGLFSTTGVTPGTWCVWLVVGTATLAALAWLMRTALRR